MRLKAIVLTGGLVLVVLGFSASAWAINTAHYTYTGFAAKDQELLKKAMNLAVTRMQSERIWREAYSHAGYALVTNSAYRGSNLIDVGANSWNILWRQLYYLSLPNAADDVEPAFPNIHVTGSYTPPSMGQNGWLGRAQLDTVKVIKNGKSIKQSGEFWITLNTYFFNRSTYYADPNEWAGTIAHEMLHNLGHRHDDTKVRYDSLQIIAMDRSVKLNGNFAAMQEKAAIQGSGPDECDN